MKMFKTAELKKAITNTALLGKKKKLGILTAIDLLCDDSEAHMQLSDYLRSDRNIACVHLEREVSSPALPLLVKSYYQGKKNFNFSIRLHSEFKCVKCGQSRWYPVFIEDDNLDFKRTCRRSAGA